MPMPNSAVLFVLICDINLPSVAQALVYLLELQQSMHIYQFVKALIGFTVAVPLARNLQSVLLVSGRPLPEDK